MARITIIKRSSDYMAYKDGDKAQWECAITPTYAVRKLVARFPELKNTEDIVKKQ